MKTKHAGFRLKAVNEAEGTFEAIVAVFGNVDRANDRIIPGAFVASLARWKASGDPIPVIWSHEWDDPFGHIGYVVDARETTEGLWVKAKIDLDEPRALQVFKLLAGRRVREFSFAYDVVNERRAADGANELLELEIIEVGPTLKGMNPETRLLVTKAAPRGGRGLSPSSTKRYIDALETEWSRSRATHPQSPASVLATIDQMETR